MKVLTDEYVRAIAHQAIHVDTAPIPPALTPALMRVVLLDDLEPLRDLATRALFPLPLDPQAAHPGEVTTPTGRTNRSAPHTASAETP